MQADEREVRSLNTKKAKEKMKMFYYNSKFEEKNDGENNVWTAKLENGKLVVRRYEDKKHEKRVETYYVDGFHNCSECQLDEANIWYSFDAESGNFHIVPDISVGKEFADNADLLFSNINAEMKDLSNSALSLNIRSGINHNHVSGSPYVKCHKYKTAKTNDNDKYGYLISFNRLWCKKTGDKEYHIHNNFGQVQFMRYRIKCDSGKEFANRYQNINWDVGPEFKMMYPTSDESAEGGSNYMYNLDGGSGHLSYNVPFTINDCPELIAKAFAKFIELGEQAEKGKKEVEDIPNDMKTHCEKLKCHSPVPTTYTKL